MDNAVPPHMLPILKDVMESENPMSFLKPGMGAREMFELIGKRGESNLEFINTKYEFKQNDVLIASYPKTGTNWLLEVVHRLMYQDEGELAKWTSLPLPLKMFEMGISKKFQIIDTMPFERRVFGTHVMKGIDFTKLKAKNVKIVYIIRNPKDTLVSMYNFLQKLPPFQQEPMKSMVKSGWTHFYDLYMKGEFPMDGEASKHDYLDHILEWLKVREEFGIHFIYYENLKKDFKEEVRKLAKHLDVAVSEEKLQEISGNCTIDAMKKSYAGRNDFQAKHASAFINKGGVGGWKNYFTVEQSEQWDRMVKQKLAATDISFKYTI